jgi:hypothetical protein
MIKTHFNKKYIEHSIRKFEGSKELIEYYKSITNSQWLKLLEIPEAKDFKDGFEYISSCKINVIDEIEISITINGKKYVI